jgi:hypothetical protein
LNKPKAVQFWLYVDDIAGFQMIYIIDLFDRFLLLFYEMTYWPWEHVHSLIHGSFSWKCTKCCSFDLYISADDSASFQMMYEINMMEEFFHYFPWLENWQMSIMQQSAAVMESTSTVHLSGDDVENSGRNIVW